MIHAKWYYYTVCQISMPCATVNNNNRIKVRKINISDSLEENCLLAKSKTEIAHVTFWLVTHLQTCGFFRLWSGRDEARVYMLFEFVAGGELFSYLRAAGRFAGPTSCFYAAEIVSALDYLHNKHIVYRDLKPENLLLDSQGHLKITDFGFSKKLTDR